MTATSLKTTIVANYPKNFETPLISEKITELKRILDSYKTIINTAAVNKSRCSDIRLSIYSAIEINDFEEIDIPIDKEDGKKIWESLKNDLPLFFIFQADRQNKDSDKEVQDPLKAITKSAINQLSDQLEKVKEEIKIKAEEIGNQTIEKLKEMNPEIANTLKPEMSTKAWESLFSFSFTCDDGIPINKRGSGVRRLILLNYFRAEAERQNSNKNNIIYAIEEPETSQHPDWQVELFKALIELSQKPNTQVITTTHSPSLAGLVEPESLVFLYRDGDSVKAESGDSTNLEKIANALGVLPDVSIFVNKLDIKAIVCVEGPTDVEFFNRISKIFDIDIDNHPEILIISLGGGTLHHWVNKNYLKKLCRPEVHIYDSDVKKYQIAVNEVNSRPNSWGAQTEMYEIENYIHPSLIQQIYQINEDFTSYLIKLNEADSDSDWRAIWKKTDVPKTLSRFLKELKLNKYPEITGEGPDSIKKTLSERGSSLMTAELLRDLNAFDEVNNWFNKIKAHLA